MHAPNDADRLGSPGAPAAPSSDEEEGGEGEEKKRKVLVREGLYSLEILSEREGMLESCTGFSRREVDLLVIRFEEARSACPCFVSLPFWLRAYCPALRLAIY